MSCSIEEVLAPNGRPSKLFNDILSTVGDPELALLLYLDSKLRGPGEARTDENGEPYLSSIYTTIGFTQYEQNIFISQRPDLHAPRADRSKKQQTADRRTELPSEILGIEEMLRLSVKRMQDARDSAKNSDQRQWYNEQLKRLKDQRNRVFWFDAAADIQKVAEEQLLWARKIAMSRNPSKQSLRLAMDLVNAWSWDTTSNFLSPESSADDSFWGATFSEIASEAQKISLFVDNAILKNIKRTLEREGVEVSEEELRRLNQISGARRVLFDLSTVDDKLAQFIDATLKRASRNQAEHLRQISEKLGDLSEGVDQSKLLQRDKDGNLTGNLIAPFSLEYMETIRKAQYGLQRAFDRSAESSTKQHADRILQSGYKDYYQSRRSVEIAIDLRRLQDPKRRAAYVADLTKDLGVEAAQNAIRDAEAAFILYQNERDSAIQRFNADFVGGEADVQKIDDKNETIVQYIDRKTKEWKIANSPYQFVDEFYAIGGMQYGSTDGHRYSVVVPRKTDFKGTDLGNYDPAYDQLGEKEKALLDFVLDLSANLREYLPDSKTRDMGAGFLPVVHKDIIERVLGNGSWMDVDVRGGYQQARAQLLNSFLDPSIIQLGQQQEKARKSLHPITGEEIRQIPIKFVEGHSLVRRSGETDQEYQKRRDEAIAGRSFDIVKVMEMFSAMAINYKHMSDVEDKIMLAQRIVNEAEEVRLRGGNPLFDWTGKLVTVKEGKTQLKEMVDYSISAMLYGNNRLSEEGVTDIAIYDINPLKNHRLSNQAREIKRQADILEEKHDNNEISNEEYKTEFDKLNEQYMALNGRRLSVGKSMDNVLKFTQLKGMGWNLTAGIANLGFGLLSNVIHSGAGIDFDGRELLTASRIMLKSRSNPNSKAAALIKKLDVLFEVTEIGYGKNAERRKFRKLDYAKNPFEVQRRTEFFLQGTSVVAQLLHEKITDLEGKERTLWDAYTNEGIWNEVEFGPEPKEWKSLLEGDEQNKFTKTRDRIIQVNKKLHGNYDPNSKVEAKKWVMGRALLMFRSWMAEGFEWRFAHEHYDRQLGRNIKGRWLSYKDVSKEHGFTGMVGLVLSQLFHLHKMTINGQELNELDLQNIRSNIYELRLYLGMMVALTMLTSALRDDDDDEENLALSSARILIAQMYRVEADLVFYASMDTMMQITKNPIPAMKTISDFQNAMSSTWKYLKKGEEFEGLDPWWKWMKAFPIGTQGYKMWYMGSNNINWGDL